MGELIEFRKDRGEVWSDTGEPVEPPPEDASRLRLLLLPILLFLDALAALLALLCRPVAASLVLVGALGFWAGLRDGIGIAPGWSLGICLGLWVVAHFRDYDLDRLVRRLESGEAALMRAASARSVPFGRVLHVALYAYVAVVPGFVLALATGVLMMPHWLPESIRGPIQSVPPLGILLAAPPLAVTAIVMRYRWHPIARHVTPTGRRRKLTLAA
jgi:hypothetical protein